MCEEHDPSDPIAILAEVRLPAEMPYGQRRRFFRGLGRCMRQSGLVMVHLRGICLISTTLRHRPDLETDLITPWLRDQGEGAEFEVHGAVQLAGLLKPSVQMPALENLQAEKTRRELACMVAGMLIQMQRITAQTEAA